MRLTSVLSRMIKLYVYIGPSVVVDETYILIIEPDTCLINAR